MPDTPARNTYPSPLNPEGVTFLPVSPRLVTARFIERGGWGLLFLLVTSVPLVLRATGVWPGYPAVLAWVLPAAVLLIVLWVLALVRRQVRAIGYAERDDDLLIRHGILFQRVLVVPYGRMQFVDVTVGPLERALGLSSLKLHTAAPGTEAMIHGLTTAEAARLRERLPALGEAKLAGL
ncbi:PH domain-containing protein [Specibacter cremeus]|uniref:PH domain-containing protein n=1 Tax=Specibacter cremeus TaxID=1629051 RepID=UPI000F76B8A8|nr:PH domain-containing protein [Specibacter cremeus]